MRELEIDSDKFTTLAMCGCLVASVWGVIAGLLRLTAQKPWPHSRSWIDYFVLLVFSFWAVGGLFDRKFRRTNRYWLAGVCFFVAAYALWLFLPGASEELWGVPILLEIGAWVLWLIGSVRWLRSKVSWVPVSEQGRDSTANEYEKGD